MVSALRVFRHSHTRIADADADPHQVGAQLAFGGDRVLYGQTGVMLLVAQCPVDTNKYVSEHQSRNLRILLHQRLQRQNNLATSAQPPNSVLPAAQYRAHI